MANNVEILRMLLQEVDEDPKTFEENPMEFILDKYISLNNIMTELMTDSYREYLDAVFIVSPKPTSFKIVLHNAQYFYLTYMGPAYEASVAGKNYYLSNVGEKERCMLAISKLLRGGNPLKTKGPEGAEQGAEAEEGEDSGGEGGLSATGGAEEGGEEAPQLTESVLKSIVERAISIKEVSSKPQEEIIKYAIDSLKKNGINSNREKKKNTDPHIRALLGSDEEATDKIKSIFDGNVRINVVPPGETSEGSQSGTYDTYKVILTKNVQNIPKGTTLYVVNQTRQGKSSIAAKSLTPSAFGMTGVTYKNPGSIINNVQKSLNSMQNKELANALKLMMRDLKKSKSNKVSSVSEIKEYSKKVSLAKDTQDALSTILPGDLAIVGKDFGEILGAILMAKEINIKKGITFPGGNQPLVDFYVDGYGISSKYKTGAAATLTKLIDEIKREQLTTEAQKTLYDTLYGSLKLGVSDSYLDLAKKLNTPALDALAKVMKVDKNSITINGINEYILKLLGSKIPTEKNSNIDNKIDNALKPFFLAAGSSPSYPIKWGSLSKNLYGIVMGPMSAAVAKDLNSKPEYITALKEMIAKVEIKQLYLDFDLKSNSMMFKLKSFADPSATFSFTPSNISVYNPDNGKMGFKMK